MNPDRYISEPTKRTPWILLEPGRVFIMGRSIPDDPAKFFCPVLNWISEHPAAFAGKIRIDMGFEYINTASTKWVYLVLKELSGFDGISLNAVINWHYETDDEDLHELGHILRSLIRCPLNMHEVSSMNQQVYEKVFSTETI